MDIHFILVEPAVPENVGASARALKTMGFKYLRLVNTSVQNDERSKWLAHGSLDVLDTAKNYETFNQSIADLDFVIGTTAKRRSVKNDYHPPEVLAEMIRKKGNSVKKVGIVFGGEESGLTNETLRICDVASTIPLAGNYPSLNLAQCVMLYAYVLRDISGNSMQQATVAHTVDFTYLKGKIHNLLCTIGIAHGTNLYHRIMERVAVADEDDLHLMLSAYKKIADKISSL